MITLRLLSRAGCHLCEQLEEALLVRYAGRLRLESMDISDDPVMLRRYGLRIPVVLAGDREIASYPPDWAQLDACLDEMSKDHSS